jgi:nucleotide-binding universal stress UspA family protein
MIEDILVHVDGTQSGRHRLAYALGVAGQHRAHLTAAHVIPPADVPTVFKPSLVGRATEVQEERDVADAKHAKQYFERTAHANGVNSKWLDLSGNIATQLSIAARCVDLVIVGQYEWQRPAERHPLSIAESLVLECGRPVLVVPGGLEAAQFRRALIAWDGSREAVRTVHDALPLLWQSGSRVEIAIIREDDGVAASPLIEHLRRHQIEAEETPQSAKETQRDAALLERLKEGQFDLLVMGAYSHPAWLELLFGGTTSRALTELTVPILISH